MGLENVFLFNVVLEGFHNEKNCVGFCFGRFVIRAACGGANNAQSDNKELRRQLQPVLEPVQPALLRQQAN